MTIQSEIENRIKRERRKLAELRNEITRREAFVQGLLEAMKMLSANETEARELPDTRRTVSDVKRAYDLLCGVHQSLHISDILKGIGKEDTKQNRMSLGSSLARYARKGEMFQREGPNEFSAIDAGPSEEASLDDLSHPQFPPFFGEDDIQKPDNG